MEGYIKKIFIFSTLIFSLCGNVFSFDKGKNLSDYFLMIKAFVAPAIFLNSDITEEERNFWKLEVIYSDGSILTGKPELSMLAFGASAEYLFKNFGFVLCFSPIFIKEILSIGDNEEYEMVTYSGDFVKAYKIDGGVNYHIPLETKRTIFDFYFGAKIGYIWGDLIPYPSRSDFLRREYSYLIPDLQYFIDGYSLAPYIGVNFIYSHILGGGAVSYNFNNFFTKESLKNIYKNIDRSIIIHYITLELYVGLIF